jgi:hypothetical protein
MVLLGLVLLALGLAVPGKASVVVSTLLVLGASIAVAGLAVNRFKQVEVGPQGVKMSRDSDDAVPAPWLATEAEMLNRIAVRVLGDQDLAREAVERSLTTIRQRRSDIPKSQLDIATYKTLISELHRKDRNRNWPGASRVESSVDGVPLVLQSLSFGVRVTYALSYEFQDGDTAEILGRTKDEVESDVRMAESVVGMNEGDNV